MGGGECMGGYGAVGMTLSFVRVYVGVGVGESGCVGESVV